MKKLWVDDIRPAPDKSWDIATSYDTAIYLLTQNEYDVVSLDHDLGDFSADGREMTGYDILLWIVNRKMNNLGYVPKEIKVHSANVVASDRMRFTIHRYLKD